MIDAQSDLMETLGLVRILDLVEDPGEAVLEFRSDDRHCHSVVQGGFITAWLDAAMARAVGAATNDEFGTSTMEIKVSFLRPAPIYKTFLARGWIVQRGPRIVFLEADLTDEDEQLIAKASSTAKLSTRIEQG